MSVDWFTVAAQIINFLILVWLLKRFLYKPVLTVMSNRQQRVEDELKQAATLAKSAEKEKEYYLTLQEEARELGKKELLQARMDADNLREKLYQEVKAEAEVARVRGQKELAREKDLFLVQASEQIAEQFHRLAQRVFRDLAHESLEESIVSHFCTLISNHETEQDLFRQLEKINTMQVSTAFSLSKSSQTEIREALQLRLKTLPEISFYIDPSLIGGILLVANDHKLEWNINRYLDDFQEELKTFLSKGRQE